MRKTVIALAIAGMAAAPAFADSNVTLYGSIDYGFGTRTGNSGLGAGNANSNPAAAHPAQEFMSGTDVQNRLGFKGAEDLGNGTKVIFEIEMGFLADTGTNSLPTNPNESSGIFRNHSWVGLTGDWGTVIGGRVDGSRYGVSERYDPFAGGTVATPLSLNGQVTRGDNAIAYVTPNVQGLYAILAYTTSLIGPENTSCNSVAAPTGTNACPSSGSNTGDVRLWLIQANYVNGPLSVTLNTEHDNVHNLNIRQHVYDAAVSYDFGVAKLMAMWDKVTTDGAFACGNHPCGGVLADERMWNIGGTVPITEQDTLRAVYADYHDGSAAQNSCSKWGVGGEHFLSKRTNLYLDFAAVNQKDHGACTIYYNSYQSSADAGTGSNTGGVGTRGFDVGMVHRF
jgi:predicted porin